MQVCELFGPTGCGKTSVYKAMLEHGGFAPDGPFPIEKVLPFMDQQSGPFKDFHNYLDNMFSVATQNEDPLQASANRSGGHLVGSRITGAMRHNAKLCWASQKEGKEYLVMDGGLIHGAMSFNRGDLDWVEYMEKMPLPDVAAYFTAPKDVLIERNKERYKDGASDKSKDIDEAIWVAEMAAEIAAKRGCKIIEVDATNSIEMNAAKILSITNKHENRKFRGHIVNTYTEKRKKQEKWHNENRIIREYLEDVKEGDSVFDCPVGDGRFVSLYEEKGLLWHGADAEQEMLDAAKGRTTNEKLCCSMTHGDIVDVAKGMADNSVDVSMMIRLTRWITPEKCQEALKELQRITRRKIIFTARVRNAHKVHVRPYGLFTSVLDGWEITEDQSADGPDYRVILLEPKDR
jgi:hypothetical protein